MQTDFPCQNEVKKSHQMSILDEIDFIRYTEDCASFEANLRLNGGRLCSLFGCQTNSKVKTCE